MASFESTTVIIFLILIVIGLYMARNERRMKLFLRDNKATNLSETLERLNSEILSLQTRSGDQEQKIKHLDGRVLKSIQKIETIRFNAFPDAGGGQSFATVLLDEGGNGVVLSSLYLRDRVSMFAKPIIAYTSTFTLTPEESQALEKAKARS